MLIVKGIAQKSILANILLDKTKSICFQYYDMPVIWGSICVDSNEYSLVELAECIEEEFEVLNAEEKHFDYLIIYTNEKEKDLEGFINWLDEYRWKICCNDIIVMCKE